MRDKERQKHENRDRNRHRRVTSVVMSMTSRRLVEEKTTKWEYEQD